MTNQQPLGLFQSQQAMDFAREAANNDELWAQAWGFASIGDSENLRLILDEMDSVDSEEFRAFLVPNCLLPNTPEDMPCLLA